MHDDVFAGLSPRDEVNELESREPRLRNCRRLLHIAAKRSGNWHDRSFVCHCVLAIAPAAKQRHNLVADIESGGTLARSRHDLAAALQAENK